MWIVATIVVCCWAIALHIMLYRRDRDVKHLLVAVQAVADGKYHITRNERGYAQFKPINRGVK